MIVVLAGGVGGARFIRGLVAAVGASDITAVVNVGDDIEICGLRICPDLDSITYRLAGLNDPVQQWGRADESFVVSEELARLGMRPSMTLGDRDLALHLYRTAALRGGATLSTVTATVTASHGLGIRLIPVSDDGIETRIHVVDGRDLHFQEWWVGERAASEVARVEYRGADVALPAPGVVEAIASATAIIVAPSNPVVSIGPIRAVPGVAEALEITRAPIVGISPIIGGQVVRGMADRLLPAVGVAVDAAAVAHWYGARGQRGLLDAWIVDNADEESLASIRAMGLRAISTDTMLDDLDVSAALARTALGIVGRGPI